MPRVDTKSLTRMRLSHRASDIYNAKKIGVALGPGLPIGLVDLGMLIALKQLKIEVNMISGTSMGAALGAYYAAGMSGEELRKVALEFFTGDKLKKLFTEDMKFLKFGLSTADRLVDELIKVLKWDPEFHELKIPLYIVASDKVSQKSIIMSHGRVFDAVRASLAIPFLVKKQKMGDMKLSDGMIFSPLNMDVLYSEGADFVIGIQAKPIRSDRIRKLPLKAKLSPYLLKATGWKTTKEVFFSKPECDILLRPRVPQYLAKDSNRAAEIIDLGVKIAYEAVTEIEKGNYPKTKLQPTYERKLEIDSINEKLDKETIIIETYLKELENRTETLSDAELMDEFPKFSMAFQAFLDKFAQLCPQPEVAAETLKVRFKNLMHLVDQSPFMSRALNKPLGYAGDYQMMNYIYDDNIFSAHGNIGKLLNYFILSSPETNAVRNRAKIIQGIVQQRFAQSSSIAIASIACGPAREVAETMNSLFKIAGDVKISWTLLDQDKEALDYASSGIPKAQHLETKLVNAGIRELIRKRIDLGKQDIIYSLGLFDYLEDKIATLIIQRLYTCLNPGGLLLIGNFQPNAPLRLLREGVTEWFLIYRTEEELLGLGKAGAPDGRHFVMAEPEGVNLILVTSRPIESNSQ